MTRPGEPGEEERAVLLSELSDLLEREREALLNARFDLLERLGAEKERLVRGISRFGPRGPGVEKLKILVGRNQELFRASLAGIARARDRAAALAGGCELRTYDRKGRLCRAASPPRTQHTRHA